MHTHTHIYIHIYIWGISWERSPHTHLSEHHGEQITDQQGMNFSMDFPLAFNPSYTFIRVIYWDRIQSSLETERTLKDLMRNMTSHEKLWKAMEHNESSPLPPRWKISISRDLTPSNREELKRRSYVTRQTAQAGTDSTAQVDLQRSRLTVTSKAHLKNKSSSATYIQLAPEERTPAFSCYSRNRILLQSSVNVNAHLCLTIFWSWQKWLKNLA